MLQLLAGTDAGEGSVRFERHRPEQALRSAPASEKIPGLLGMQSGLNSVSMAVGVMEKTLYSSYTP